MEEFDLSFERKQNAVTKKRSQISRRPRTTLQFLQICDHSPMSTTLSPNDGTQVSSDDSIGGHANHKMKEFSISQSILFGSEDSTSVKGTSSSHSRIIGSGAGDESKAKRVKLKFGSISHTIQTKASSLGVSGGGSSKKSNHNSDSSRSRPKLILQDNLDEDLLLPVVDLQEIALNDSSRHGKDNSSKGEVAEENAFDYQGEKLDPVRKSTRLTKKRVLDGDFNEVDEDDEIKYLKKLKISKFANGSENLEEESIMDVKQIFRVSKNVKLDDTSEGFVSSRSKKDYGRSRPEIGSEDMDNEEDLPTESKPGLALTTRQRALLSSKAGSSLSGASEVEFPNGLLPAPPKKQKEKLSEMEQQLKKAEAAKRRKMQVEKAARESEAEAIRKILGQDSNRKKRGDKIKKRMDELAQEKAANALMLASNTVRWVMGPAGTVVTFSKDLGLPSIFNQSPCNYPAPRENCAGPSCTNPYKYRDSESKLPLCSLQCYKAVHEKVQNQTIV